MRASLSVGRQGSIIAVEMDKESYNLMTRNLYENKIDNVKAINCAVGDYDGEIEYIDGGRQANSIHQNLNALKAMDVKVKKVIINKLDTIISNSDFDVVQRSIFASLEVNGAEPQVLLGADSFLRNSRNLQMRIAAPYSVGKKSCKTQIVNILNNYHGIHHYDVPPQVVVSKMLA